MSTAVSIHLAKLESEQVATLLSSYEQLIETLRVANNSLIQKLMETEGFNDDLGMVLNDWSLFTNRLHENHSLFVERTTSTVN